MTIRDKTLLVSAAAGSGKTATLTERIIRSVTDKDHPADISKMLIVTFTRAAADELKSRIFGALSDALAKDPSNRHLTSQLIQLGSAKICTIDSFYLDLLRSNFSVLGLSSSFRIADPTELELLARVIMEDTVEYFYEIDDTFPSLAECFSSTRSADRLIDTLLDLNEEVSTIPQGIDFLEISANQTESDAEKDFLSTSFGSVLLEHSLDMVRYCISVFEEACAFCERDVEISKALLRSFEYDRNFCYQLADALENSKEGYVTVQRLLEGFSPIRVGRLKPESVTEESENFKALRTKLHTKLRDLKKKSFSHSVEDIRRAMLDTANITRRLYSVLKEYQTRMTEEKKRRNILDFSDIRRYTLQLLVDADGNPTPTARRYAEQFSDIYIDEYQDVDRVQDLIFSAISRSDNRFMVGDIKQSIYSFRGAEPQVFAEYRERFPAYDLDGAADKDAVTVFMSENFRCDENVIKFTNLICSRIFSACKDSIDYKPEDDLVFSKPTTAEDYVSPKVQVSILIPEETIDGEDASSDEIEEEILEKEALEAEYIAGEIDRLIRFEKKADGTPIVAGDIAVLFRSRSMSSELAGALQKRGIASSESDAERYFENPDVLMVLCLLNTIDNPHRDIFLTGTLRSLLFGFSMDDLIRIRSACDESYSLYDALLVCTELEDDLGERCRFFDRFLNDMREKSVALSVDRLLRLLFESDLFVASGLVNSQTEDGEGGNLLRLYEYARTFEAGSFKGLYNFIEFINTVIEEDRKMKIPPKGVSPNRVNLMTIHQSKGLEFPVCFVCGTGKQFNRQDVYASLLFEYPRGIAMKIADSTGFARINTPMREALAANVEIRQIEEEMRVLYVALTRARERLYVTAASKKTEDHLMSSAAYLAAFCGRYTLLHCKSYLDWILIPFADPSHKPACAELRFLTAEHLREEYSFDTINADPMLEAPSTDREDPVPDPQFRQHLSEQFAYRYPYSKVQHLPAKLSVSRLSPDALDEHDSSVDLFPTQKTQKKTVVPDFFLPNQPARSNAAQRGTATHLFLQFCDFERACRNGIKNEIARLIERRFIPENIASLIFEEELELFLKSDLMPRIQSAERIIREQRFNIFLSPENFTQNEEFRQQLQNERLAVQGVIDLILLDQDGNPTLYDYKTDRLTREELQNAHLACEKMNRLHGLQLSYYSHAVSLLFGKPCKSMFVYSTHAGRLFEIEKQDLIFTEEILDIL